MIFATIILVAAAAALVYHMVIDARLSAQRDNLQGVHFQKDEALKSARRKREIHFPDAEPIILVDELTPEQEGEILSEIDQILAECDALTEEISTLKERAMNS